MKIGFIGAGKVGQTFGRYLKQSGHEITGYYSRTYDHAVAASEAVNGKAFETVSALVEETEILLITVTDQAIAEVAETLKKIDSTWNVKVIAHMSGAMPASIMARRDLTYYASVHPLQSFAVVEDAFEQMGKTIFSVEGDAEAKALFKSLLNHLGNEVILLTEAQKVDYHMAAVIASNYLVTLMDFGISRLGEIGIDEAIGLKALLPLIKGTLTNLETLGTEKALTGPIARGDSRTVEAHLTKLDGEAKTLYRALGRATVKIAQRKGLEAGKIKTLGDLLKEE